MRPITNFSKDFRKFLYKNELKTAFKTVNMVTIKMQNMALLNAVI